MRFFAVIFVAAAFYLIAATSGQAAPIEGLVLYLPFDEGEGDTAHDLSGKENHGALMGDPEWVTGRVGSALEFSGEENSNYVEVPDHPSLNPASEITCAAWIYFDEFHPSCGIISKYIGAGNQRSYNIHMSHTSDLSVTANCSSNGAFQVGVSTTEAVAPGGTLKAGEWQHVAMTFEAKKFLRIYINGKLELDADAGATDSLFDNDTPLLVGTDFQIGGAHGGANPREFTGIIDEVAIFNRALSENEIQRVMNLMIMSVESYGKLTIVWGAVKAL